MQTVTKRIRHSEMGQVFLLFTLRVIDSLAYSISFGFIFISSFMTKALRKCVKFEVDAKKVRKYIFSRSHFNQAIISKKPQEGMRKFLSRIKMREVSSSLKFCGHLLAWL